MRRKRLIEVRRERERKEHTLRERKRGSSRRRLNLIYFIF